MSQLKSALLIFIVFSVLTGIFYPLAITGIAQGIFKHKTNGSIIELKGKPVGSELIGQSFTKPQYFQSRPSSINYDANYIGKNDKGEDDPKNSSGTNYAPTNKKLIEDVSQRIEKFRSDNQLSSNTSLPADIVTCSASGLDPHISVEAALLQVSRIAKIRGLNESAVKDLIHKQTKNPFAGLSGEPVVNVLKLNIALDEATK